MHKKSWKNLPFEHYFKLKVINKNISRWELFEVYKQYIKPNSLVYKQTLCCDRKKRKKWSGLLDTRMITSPSPSPRGYSQKAWASIWRLCWAFVKIDWRRAEKSPNQVRSSASRQAASSTITLCGINESFEYPLMSLELSSSVQRESVLQEEQKSTLFSLDEQNNLRRGSRSHGQTRPKPSPWLFTPTSTFTSFCNHLLNQQLMFIYMSLSFWRFSNSKL